jgi:hypothetical protein
LIPRVVLFLFLIVSCVSVGYSYQIDSLEFSEIDSRLNIEIDYLNDDLVNLSIQIFPQKTDFVDEYKLVFDMKFREDYDSEFNGICIGPYWEDFGSGEFTITLKKENNFKSNISGSFKSEIDERCNTFYFYLRYFELVSTDSKVYQIGVATDYAKDYPDAPEIWVLNKNLNLEQVGSTTIEKYSINFVLER